MTDRIRLPDYYQRRFRLYEKVVESWGREAAETLMALLPHLPYEDANEEVAALRRRVTELENELVARPPAEVP